jgi:hypothetical protein
MKLLNPNYDYHGWCKNNESGIDRNLQGNYVANLPFTYDRCLIARKYWNEQRTNLSEST